VSERRVVITGIGLITPAGPDRESSWQGLCRGDSTTRLVSIPGLPAPVCGAPLPAGLFLHAPLEPLVDLALATSAEALAHANHPLTAYDPSRVGCVIGTSKGGCHALSAAWQQTHRPDASAWPHRPDPWTCCDPQVAARTVSQHWNLQGPCLAPVAACATGLLSIARGADLITLGRCDAVLAGSVDASLLPAIHASFRRLGVLAPVASDPTHACRPFHKDRGGFVIGEGGAVLMLEQADLARARQAPILADWRGASLAADAGHLTRLSPDPEPLIHLLRDTLRQAEMSPAELDYINYHGTATRGNDPLESQAVELALGTAARSIPGSSLKGTIGHLLGGAGSVELAATVLALRDQTIPPTLHLDQPDPACRLDYTPHHARPSSLQTALKLSLGFGGHLVCAVISRPV
jgi:3-oxoacyl-[acyl-carrier-protein] synthase II